MYAKSGIFAFTSFPVSGATKLYNMFPKKQDTLEHHGSEALLVQFF